MKYNHAKGILIMAFILVSAFTLSSRAEAEDVCAYECGGVTPITDCTLVTIGCTDFKILP
ncbi:MAG: hypothetical protein AB1488_08595 [Nitrospirota bacterium]